MSKKKSPNRQIALDPAARGEMREFGGSALSEWNAQLVHATVNAVPQAGQTGPLADQALAAAVAGLASMTPRDAVEASIVAQLVAANAAALDLYRRAWLPEQDYEVRVKYLGLADRAARTVATLAEALTRYRSAGKQTVVVQHVTVAEGGQAVVAGQIAGRGEQDEGRGQPHALDARGPALPGTFETDRAPVPRPGGEGT